MVIRPSPDTIYVIMGHYQQASRTIAAFTWPTNHPTETYTTDKGDISLRLDAHSAVRPTHVVWPESSNVGEESALEDLFGKEFTHHFVEVRRTAGMCAMTLSLSPFNRLSIAKLQFESPSTPYQLKEVLGGMIGGLTISLENLDPPAA